jgi:SAM-dependent methyltransferase
MLKFISKELIWEAQNDGASKLIDSKISYQLKTAQDLAIVSQLRSSKDKRIAEIGGGDSRVLNFLANNNKCSNIEKFEGKHIGPSGEINLHGVENIPAYIGDFDPALKNSVFDILFSISVVEHIVTDDLDNFFDDSLRILRTGGIFIHAIDLYLGNEADTYHQTRLCNYRAWVQDNAMVSPLAEIYQGDAVFSTQMATNPDNILYGWNTLVPDLAQLRSKSQSVSLLVAGVKN